MLSEIEQSSDVRMFGYFVKRNFKKLLLFGLAGAVLSLIITLFIPKEYKSYAIVYPPSSTAIESSIDYPNFGYDVEADRLIQILDSREIRDSVIKKFGLEDYYEVNKDRSTWHDELVKWYGKDVKFERTTSMAVIISVKNKNADTAAAIANYIVHSADKFREKIYKNNIVPAFEQAEMEYLVQKHKVDSAEMKLLALLKQNDLTSLLLLTSDAQINIQLDKLSSAASGAQELGPEIVAFKSMYRVFEEAHGRFVKIKKTLDNPIPRLFIIQSAEPMYKKVSPSYSVSVLAGFVLTVFLSACVLLLMHLRDHTKTSDI